MNANKNGGKVEIKRPKMKVCTRCGHPNPKHARICQNCGKGF